MKVIINFSKIIDGQTVIITFLAILSTYLCDRFGFYADLPSGLIGIAIIFPIVFSINSAYKRREEALKSFSAAYQAMISGNYDLVILDEVNIAAAWKLLEIDAIIELIDSKPADVDLILTGRYADQKLIEKADLVTEMKEIKHPYASGTKARKGIDY